MVVLVAGVFFGGCSQAVLNSLLQEPANNERNLSVEEDRGLNALQAVYKPEGYGFKGEQYFKFEDTMSDKYKNGINQKEIIKALEPKKVKRCQTPQDKVEGCIEMTIYKPNEKTPYGWIFSLDEVIENTHTVQKNLSLEEQMETGEKRKRLSLDDIAEVERQECLKKGRCHVSKGLIEYGNAVAKYFENNQVERIVYFQEVRIDKRWNWDKSILDKEGEVKSSVSVSQDELISRESFTRMLAFSKELPFHRVNSIIFYKGEELSRWLKGIKECKTRADIKGTCVESYDAMSSVFYIDGKRYVKRTLYNRGSPVYLSRVFDDSVERQIGSLDVSKIMNELK